jgi:YHS domain-containing protein
MKINALILLLIVFACSNSKAQNATTDVKLRVKQFNLEKSGLALQGYDPVSYYLGKPQKGTTSFSYTYNGVSYKFANEKNMNIFKASPAKFEPAYGGWCAYAMGATGEKVEVDPETFKIVNGKLYLFYNAIFTNTLPKWNKDEKNLNKNADVNWLKLYK